MTFMYLKGRKELNFGGVNPADATLLSVSSVRAVLELMGLVFRIMWEEAENVTIFQSTKP